MARKKKEPEPEAKPAAAAATEEAALLMPSTNLVRQLAKQKKQVKIQTGEIAGTLGSAIQKAVEEKHLDKKAFAIATQLDRIDDERLAITYFHLLRYMDDLKIPERANATETLFAEGEMAAGYTDTDGKVTHIGDAARRVSEQAGSA